MLYVHLRENTQIGRFGDKIRVSRLRWFGQAERRDGEYVVMSMLKMTLLDKRKTQEKVYRRY